MRATTTSGAASGAASILRSLETTAQLEPAFRVLSPLSSLFFPLVTNPHRAISTSSSSFLASPSPPPPRTEGDLNNTLINKKITTLPQLSSAMQLAYNSRHYDQVLSLYSQGDDQIIKPASKSDPRSAATTYDCALKACAAAAEARQAQRILSTMWKRRVPVGRVAQGSVLKALCAAGQRQTAFQHVKAIPAARVTTMHCNTVLSACAAAHDVTVGLKVWEFMKRRGIELDNVSYCDALRIFGAAGNVENLVSLWENEIHPTIIGGSSIGGSSSNSSTTNTAIVEEVSEEVLLQKRNESNTMVATAYGGALAAAGQVQAAMDQCESIMDMLTHLLPQELHLAIELETERTDGHQSALKTKNKTTSSTTSGGRQTAAPLDNLRSACNAVLHAAVSSHQWHYLRKMVALMTSRGLPPDVITYNALLKAAVKRGEGPQPIHEGIAEMKALGLQPSSTTFTLLIEAYATEGDVEGAQNVFNSIAQPDSAAWNAVLRAHSQIGDLAGLGQTFQLMVDQGEVVPDESTYVTCFEGIATGLRKHASVLESIHALQTGGDGDSGGRENSATRNPSAASVESKKIAMDVLYQVEHHMKKNMTSSSPAMRAALVKAHGCLHHTALVWSLLADEYIYNNVLSFNKYTIKRNNRIIASPAGVPQPPLPAATVHHALPPKQKILSTELETELLQALSTASSTNNNTNNTTTTRNFYTPRVLNAGISQLIRAGRTDLVIQLLNSLPKSGYIPDSDTYTALISACATTIPSNTTTSTSGHHQPQLKPAFGRQLVTHMQEQHALVPSALNPCTRVYNALVRVECARAGVNAAVDVVEEMKNKAIQPDTHTWMVLRGCAVGHGRSDVAEQAMYEIQILKHGRDVNKKRTSIDSTVDLGTVGVTGVEALGVGTDINTSTISTTAVQEDERHWKGYYASDEEDEW